MAVPPGKVPILDAVKAGYAFLRANGRATAPAAVLGAAIYTAAEITGSGENVALALVFNLGAIVFGLVFTAFALRLALRQDGAGVLGLQFGKDESNLFGASLVVGFFMLIFVVVGFFLFSIAVAMVAQQSGVSVSDFQGDAAAAEEMFKTLFSGPGGPVLFGFAAVLLSAMLYLSARLSLVTAATIGERKLMAFTTWRWTEGNALRILAALFLLILPVAFAVGTLAGFLAASLGVQGSNFSEGPLPARAVVLFLSGLGQYAVLSPVVFGMLAHLYRGLRPAELPPQS
jgi:hypothetical protein